MKKAIAIKLLKSKTARKVAIKALQNKKVRKIAVDVAKRRVRGKKRTWSAIGAVCVASQSIRSRAHKPLLRERTPMGARAGMKVVSAEETVRKSPET